MMSHHWQVGLRLMAGQWLSEWLCREEGLQWPAEEGPFEDSSTDNNSSDNRDPCEITLPNISIPVANNRTPKNGIYSNSSNSESSKVPSDVKSSKVNFKLVLAEPLPDSPWSHVNTFLEAHGGPGLQVSLSKMPIII